MKAITPVISLVMMMLISVSIVGSAYFWFNSITTSQTSQAFKVINANNGEILISNIGTSPISSLTAFVDGQQVVVNIPSAIAPSTAGKVFLENLPATSGDHAITLLSSSAGVGSKIKYNIVKVLSIYRCECFIDDIAANFANKKGYPPMIVDCIHESSFTDSYDLSLYSVVAFDGADCGLTGMSTTKQQNLKTFVSNGHGIVFTHDTFVNKKHPILEDVAGINVPCNWDGGAWDSDLACGRWFSSTSKMSSTKITENPYPIPPAPVIQPTHSTGDVLTTGSEVVGGPFLKDHYLVTNGYGNGKSAFTQWGHSARDCGCNPIYGLPGADEQKSIINSVYWTAGV